MQTATSDIRTDIVVKCPATGEVVGRVTVTSAEEVEAVAARLRAAQPAWHAMGVEGRAEWLGKWRDWILDHTDELLSMVQRETGKSWGDTANSEALVPQLINYWTDNAAQFLAEENVRPVGAANAAKKLTIAYEPYQLVGVITPWNGPLSVPMLDIPAALMAGCAVLSKPSELTPLCWQLMIAGWQEIGAPDVLDAVYGYGETGSAVIDLVDFVMFTGSVNTGRRVAVAAAQRLIPCSLELGGKDAMIVWPMPISTGLSTARCGAATSTPARSAYRSSGCTSKRRSTTSSFRSWSPGRSSCVRVLTHSTTTRWTSARWPTNNN